MEKGFKSEAAYIDVMCSSLEAALQEGFAMLAAVPESLFHFGSWDKNWSLALCPDMAVSSNLGDNLAFMLGNALIIRLLFPGIYKILFVRSFERAVPMPALLFVEISFCNL